MIKQKQLLGLRIFLFLCSLLTITAQADEFKAPRSTPAAVGGITVDVYQYMGDNGDEGDLLTTDIMSSSIHGNGWTSNPYEGSLWISEKYARKLPGTVMVNGNTYSGLGSRTWKYFENYKLNSVSVVGTNYPQPYLDKITVACYYTVCPTLLPADYYGQHDNFVIGGDGSTFAVLQTLRPLGEDLYIEAHSQDKNGTTVSPTIKIVPGKTYWVNLHFNGDEGKVKVAVFDPDDNWKQVGETVAADSIPGKKMNSRVKFGRCSPHADHTWEHEVYSYFGQILIDYTEAKFPLLPDIGEVHWVSPDGQASWQNALGSTPLNGTAACSLATANANAQPGDMVYLRGGTYGNGTYIRPVNSGTSENVKIVFSNYNNEKVVISKTAYAIFLDGKSHITVNGLNFYNLGNFFYIRNNSNHNEISHCTFDKAQDVNIWTGAIIYGSSQYNHVQHCTFSRWGYANGPADTDHAGSLFDIGRYSVADDQSYYNLIEDNTFYYGGHHCLGVWSKYCVFRNNYMHNESANVEGVNYGYRCAITHGVAVDRNLFEGNRFAFARLASGMSLRSSNNIFRFNSFYNNGLGGIQVVSMPDYTPAHYNHIYNNVFYNNGQQAGDPDFSGGIYFMDAGGSPVGNVIKNNIFFKNKGGTVTYDGVIDPQVIQNNWETGNPLFVDDESSLDPFNANLPDFHLQEASRCRDSGAFLTAITSVSGSGTQFTVADAGYFMDGWGIEHVQGDEIQLFGTTQRVRITNVNYTTNTITLDKALTWTLNQGVSLAYEDSAPDIGAYEFVPATPQSIQLNQGWNWISFNVLPADLSLDSVFTGILSQIGQVKTQTQSVIRSGGNWKGDLADMNGIGQYKMYKVKVSTDCTLTVTGTADLSTNPIPLGGGWNWVAYLPTTAMSITTALDSIKGQVLQIKSLTQSATYNGTSWTGTLTQLEPGQGYTIRMNAPGTLTYPGG
jgi:hypothetical protein